jgi:hypothetical protein
MSTPPNHKPSPNPSEKGENENEFPEKPELPRSIVRWFRGFHLHREKPKITDGLMVGLTLAVAIAAFWSALSFQKQLTDSRKAFFIDERAWVEIEPIKPTFLVAATTTQSAAFTCDIYPKNLGKTVATSISVRATDVMSGGVWDQNQGVVERSQDNIPLEIPNKGVPKVLAPGATAAAPFRLTCQAPGNGAVHYLIGRIDYCDQFGVKHWVRFCDYVVNNRGEIWACQEGNDEDKNSETPTPATSCARPN